MRICSNCGKPMYAGYCINDGLDYYCSDNCLHNHYSATEYINLFNADAAYWTTWDEDDDEDENTTSMVYKELADKLDNNELKYKCLMLFIKLRDKTGVEYADSDIETYYDHYKGVALRISGFTIDDYVEMLAKYREQREIPFLTGLSKFINKEILYEED